MSEESTAHDVLAAKLLGRLISEASNGPQAFVVLESMIVGALLFYQREHSDRRRVLETVVERAILRLEGRS